MPGDIRLWHWLIAIVIALFMQMAVLAAVFSSAPIKDKPQQAGLALRLVSVPIPGDALAKPDKPVATLPVKNTPSPRSTPKPEPRKAVKATPDPKTELKSKAPSHPKPNKKTKPRPVINFEPKPKTIALGAAADQSSANPSTLSSARYRKESVTRSELIPKISANTEPTDAIAEEGTLSAAATPTATAPLAAALSTAQSGQAKALYEGKLLTWIAQHKRYPRLARRQGLEGVVEVMFKLDPEGYVQSSSVSTSSGHAILDQAVTQLLEQASPMPTPPAFFNAELRTFRVPIAFSLR